MKHVRGQAHRLHNPRGEIYGGELVEPFERPERWDYVVAALESAGMPEPVEPADIAIDDLHGVHDPRFVTFLEEAWRLWTEPDNAGNAGRAGDMIPTCFPARRMSDVEPLDIDGRLGYFAFAAETSITAGTWPAALEAAAIARTAQQLVSRGESAAFALCRPPGHHAGIDYFGGYCFLNNAAIAAQGFLNDGAERVAVLDVDFHHGNGTQDIFYRRDDVFFASLHGDPRHEFPHFMGFAAETGEGPGVGTTANYPMMPGTSAQTWFVALDHAIERLRSWGADALVVSLGVDAFENDPISSFKLVTEDFTRCGNRIGAMGLPTVYCMEGGYAVAEIGTNVVNVLTGHANG